MSARIAVLIGLAAALSSTAVAADTVSIRADEWLPYNGASQQRPPGYMVEMATRIAEAAGHHVDYRHLPWDDALAGVRHGDFDCLVGASAEEADGLVVPATSWGVSQTAAYTLADRHPGLHDLDQLKTLRIAVIPDYSYGEDMDAWIEANRGSGQVVEIDTGGKATLAILSWLVSRKVEAVLEDRNVMLNALQAAGLAGRVVERMAVGEADPVYIACTGANPRGAEFAKLFEAGTRSLRASGELATILQRYGLSDWISLEADGR